LEAALPDTVVRMRREDFRRWEATQERRFERVAGQVVPMPAEQVVYVEIKLAVWLALRDAIRVAGVACRA
jgi:hypothetical protein